MCFKNSLKVAHYSLENAVVYIIKTSRGKITMENLVALLCCFTNGKILKLLAIGKRTKPRCFRNVNTNNLPVILRNIERHG